MKAYLEPERVTLPVRIAMNWAYRGIQPPDLYKFSWRRAWLVLRAYDHLIGNVPDPRGASDEAADQE